MIMKAVTIYQPYASLIATGAKIYETRGWATKYRGPIAIHAGMKRIIPNSGNPYFIRFLEAVNKALGFNPYEYADPDLPEAFTAYYAGTAGLPRGAVVATAELVGCWGITGNFGECACLLHILQEGQAAVRGNELLFGDFSTGRYAWELANVQALPEPVPCRGQQGLWNWEVAQR